jgi:general secretion pathway protein G
MSKRVNHLMQKGFTLVELLIVAIILAILAAIVVPQFASSTTDARESALRSDLAGIRAAIDLYRQQHGQYPGVNASSGGTCSGGTKGTGAAGTAAAFRDQLVRYTNANGDSCSLQDAAGELFPFGPYLKESQIPDNPITSDSTIEIATTGDLEMGGTGAGGGWKYDTTSGKFIANDTNTDSSGVAYEDY